MKTPIFRLALASLLLTGSLSLAAQAPVTTSSTQTVTTATNEMDSAELREQFLSVLQNYPPELGAVLKYDPSLLGNHDYLATYPALGRFLAEHPQVAHSPNFYLDRIVVRGAQSPDPAGVRMVDRLLNDLVPFAVFLVISGIVIWLIRTVIDHRRWARASQVQTDMVTKLFDRFGSNEELLAYLQSGAGTRIFDATALPAPNRTPAALSRILWTVQVGIVTTMLGLGLQLVSWRVPAEDSMPISAMAVIILSIGLGFIISAVVSNLLSRRFGLWTPQPAQD